MISKKDVFSISEFSDLFFKAGEIFFSDTKLSWAVKKRIFDHEKSTKKLYKLCLFVCCYKGTKLHNILLLSLKNILFKCARKTFLLETKIYEILKRTFVLILFLNVERWRNLRRVEKTISMHFFHKISLLVTKT